ncbi:MAG: AAA family ATPase [Woeseiaceae bacterium]|nr:AAA family ATPase [Woeseiaceae bacterium]
MLLLTLYIARAKGETPARPEEAEAEPEPSLTSKLNRLAGEIEPVFDTAAHPSEILENAAFNEAVDVLCSDGLTLTQVGNYATGANWVLRAAALEALSKRDDDGEMAERCVRAVKQMGPFPLFYLGRYLDKKCKEPTVGRVVSAADSWWRNNQAIVDTVRASVDAHLEAGIAIEFGAEYVARDQDGRQAVRRLVGALPDAQAAPLRAALDRAEATAVDESFLMSIGEFLADRHFGEHFYDTDRITAHRDEFAEELDASEPRSTVVVGPSGVGKTVLRGEFAKLLRARGWRVFRTTAQSMVADKKYIGEIEGQVRRLVDNASVAKKIVVFVDRLNELHEFGRSSSNQNSVLDQLWPDIEAGRVVVIGETSANGLQTLMRSFPSLSTTMKVVVMNPADEAETSQLAGHLLRDLFGELPDGASGEIVSESLKLAQQYLAHKSLPGSVMSLLALALLRAQRDEAVHPERNHVLAALSETSGLPEDILDDRQRLDIDALRNSFRKRVIGQDEAVECLVERVAMLKAGLSDPSRPVGVFLFAGPTGTGKTEIAKTLAEVLFGSEQQMIRLDMSEYQDADSVWRILGQNQKGVEDRSLTARIRQQPFSVVLLDEFEKAHAKVWDVFLQVFDDGRLTDARGETVDFRHTIIILTSNLGSTISNEAGPGFTSRKGGFSPTEVRRSVNRTFRREFINRLDRVVVFNPLSREVMRAILLKELRSVLGRRGLRSKQWAVEWEDSAIEFLLAEGFTPDLGARPLRRAIERHLLAPLSMSIVQNRAPEGEQFLFVRSGGDELEVEFVDPDADSVAAVIDADADTSGLSLEKIMLSRASMAGETEYLLAEIAETSERFRAPEWESDKSELLAQLNEDGFWEREDRAVVLDRIELVDRIDSAAAALARLGERLATHRGNRTLVQSIAGRLYVLREGLRDLDEERPTRAVLGLRLVTADAEMDGATRLLDELSSMYREWAHARGMRISAVAGGSERYPIVYEVSGFGSYGMLDREAGVHVFEIPSESSRFDRIRVRVNVVEHGQSVENTAGRETQIVRRYRREPSPLVRDSAGGWRTGKLELVLGGSFDLFEAGTADH